MDKFPVDFSSLEKEVNKKKAFKLSEVADKIEKVAFDVVRFKDVNDDAIAGLWQIQSSDDGEIIVAKYDDTENWFSEVEKTASSKSPWSVMVDRSGNNVSIYYKTSPIIKVAVSELGIPNGDVNLLCRYLPESLAYNEKLTKSLFSKLSESQLGKLALAHPELGLIKKAEKATTKGT